MQEFLLENILNAGYHLLLSFLASQFYPQKVSYEGGERQWVYINPRPSASIRCAIFYIDSLFELNFHAY